MKIEEIYESDKFVLNEGWRSFYVTLEDKMDQVRLFGAGCNSPSIPGLDAIETKWQWVNNSTVFVSVRCGTGNPPTVLSCGDEVLLLGGVSGFIQSIEPFPDKPPYGHKFGIFCDVKIMVKVTDKKHLTKKPIDDCPRPYSCTVTNGCESMTVTFAHLHDLKEYMATKKATHKEHGKES